MKNIYKLKLHETTSSETGEVSNELSLKITRVPGGWLYMTILGGSEPNTVFVPYNNDLQTGNIFNP